VNLIAQYDKATAHEMLDASFANFNQAQRLEQLRMNLEDRRGDLRTFRDAAACERGDIWEITDPGARAVVKKADTKLLLPGTVIDVAGEELVLLARSWGGGQPKLSLTGVGGRRQMIRARDLPSSTMVLGEISLPMPQRSTDPAYRKEVASLLEEFAPAGEPTALFPRNEDTGVFGCPDIDVHLKWSERAKRAERDIRRLEGRIKRSTTNDIGLEFDNLMKVLSDTGYISNWSLTARGVSLRRLYNELDLLLAEALRTGVFADLSPAEFGALASIFTYQARGGEVSAMPRAPFAADPIAQVSELAAAIADRERHAGLVETRYPDVGIVDSIHAWASGLDLVDIFDEDDLRAGDFVRSARQLLDLLRQIRDGFHVHGSVAGDAIRLIDRGIVEAGAPR
jgi:ATP-dependent RNA helicase HelY